MIRQVGARAQPLLSDSRLSQVPLLPWASVSSLVTQNSIE